MGVSENRSIVWRLSLLAVGMFGFGFALVPLYDVFCEALGIRSDDIREQADVAVLTNGVDASRTVKVQFLANNDGTMSWEFRPTEFELRIHPGEQADTAFLARNPARRKMTAQAIPSITPGEASLYFHKTECFCFNQQTLDAGEGIDMPLRFVIDPALPEHIRTITLSYTLFDVTAENEDPAQLALRG